MKKVVQKYMKRKGALAENEVKELLNAYKIKTTKFKVISKESEIDNLNLSFPVALKVCSSEILHKTDVGGVKLNIENKKELKKTFKKFKNKFPKEKFLVDQMVEKGVEIIVGLVQDSTFGLSIMAGIGGIYTELYKDVSFRVVPIEEIDAKEMVEEIKGKALLEGFRNINADKDLVIELIQKVAKIGEELIDKIDQMDLNPVFIYENSYCVVDAKLILK
jgi:acyl-CoA synthetase (NDP forming)